MENRLLDIYDLEIIAITNKEKSIQESWQNVDPLFKFAGDVEAPNCGCLTMIRRFDSSRVCINQEVDDMLTEQIRNDHRLPKTPFETSLAHLPVFAEWQRKLDKYRKAYEEVQG